MFSLNCVWFHFIFETKLWMGYLQIWIALNLVLFKIVQFAGLLLDSVWFSLLHFSNEILFDLAFWGGFCWMALFIHVWWVLLDIIFGLGGDFGVAFIGWGFGVSSIRIIFAGFLVFYECMGVFVIAALVFIPFWLLHFHLDWIYHYWKSFF